MVELSALTAIVVALVASLLTLRRRLLVAGRIAPRGPEVEAERLAAQGFERDRLPGERLQRERRRRAADQRRRHLARIETEAVGEQRQHGDGGQWDQPAERPAHAAFRRSGITDSTVPSVRINPPIQITVTRRLTWIFTVAWRPSRVKSPSTR